MQNEKLNKYLYDALTAACNIEMSTTGLKPELFAGYEIKWIVERGIEIIAEALKK